MGNDFTAKDWKHRRLMINFLFEKGWMPTRNELQNVIDEYELNEDFKQYIEMNE